MSVWACHLYDTDPDKRLENGQKDRSLLSQFKAADFIERFNELSQVDVLF